MMTTNFLISVSALSSLLIALWDKVNNKALPSLPRPVLIRRNADVESNLTIVDN